MRWHWIIKVSLAFTLLCAFLVVLPVSCHWAQSKLQELSQAPRSVVPRPIVATHNETQAIVMATFTEIKIRGLPPPPPAPGDESQFRSKQMPPLLLTELTECIARELECISFLDELADPELDTFVSRNFRAELVAANTEAQIIELGDIPGTRFVKYGEIKAALAEDGWWDAFYQRYPDSSGYVRITRPVLTDDRKQALIYTSLFCGRLCGSGRLIRLELTASGWHVVDQRLLWVS